MRSITRRTAAHSGAGYEGTLGSVDAAWAKAFLPEKEKR